MDEWEDPFAADLAADERDRRRQEREERRREGRAREEERRVALGDRVREVLSGGGVASSDGAAPSGDGAGPPARSEPAQGPPRQQPPRPRRTDEVLRRRRIVGGIALVAGAALVVIGLLALADRFAGGGGDTAPVATPNPRSMTIPEGYDRAQIAEIAEKDGVRGDYQKASESFKGFDPAKYGAEDAKNLEGFLFPSTYELPRKPTADDLVASQLAEFKDNIREVDLSYAKSKNLTPYDVVIIASMIDREVMVPSERDDVAAVIYNRLSQGIPLGIDATIRYEDQNYSEPLTTSRLEQATPYNTRINAGLPPGPIGNPGLDALRAAADPAKVDYLYYVVKPGECGDHFFTASEDEFNQAVARYNEARDAAGGKSPTSCPSG